MEQGCEFCRIVQGASPARIVADDPDALAVFPQRPLSRGHTLVVPRLHIPDLWSADPTLAARVIQTVIRVGQAINASLRPDGLNLVSSAGEAASQSVFHLHMHVVPRWVGDHIGSIWPPGDPLDNTAKDQAAEAIREAYLAFNAS
jgi:histidine triad (HIT) family protein